MSPRCGRVFFSSQARPIGASVTDPKLLNAIPNDKPLMALAEADRICAAPMAWRCCGAWSLSQRVKCSLTATTEWDSFRWSATLQ